MRIFNTSYYIALLRQLGRLVSHVLPRLPRSRWARRGLLVFTALVVLCIGGMYGIARWYQWSVRAEPQVIGASFIPKYAQTLGVDPKETLTAMLRDLNIKHLRLVSYWNVGEPTPGDYNFEELDWQFRLAEQYDAKVSLSLGLRQPRWPECHPPGWADTSKPVDQWQPQLEQYITKVVERYKHSPALASYQVENEYFLTAFGECQNFDRQRLIDEAALVRRLDPRHPIIINRSNNGIGTPLNAPTPDIYGVSIYKRVWDSGLTKRYLEYPQPAWYYAFMAGVQKITREKPMIVHEMQAEAWAPNSQEMRDISLKEQNKSLDAARLHDRFTFARETGIRSIYMWGAEYWYYRQHILGDHSLWQAARDEWSTMDTL